MACTADQGLETMKYRFFSVLASMPAEEEEAVNRFCAEHRVISVDKQLIQAGERSFWALCICYMDKQAGPMSTRKNRVDYREVLNDKEFSLFAKLRDLRKTLAEQEGGPVYAIFTNEQLAAMVQQHATSKSALAQIDGIGPTRLEKYGEAFLNLLRQHPLDPGEAPLA